MQILEGIQTVEEVFPKFRGTSVMANRISLMTKKYWLDPIKFQRCLQWAYNYQPEQSISINTFLEKLLSEEDFILFKELK